MIVGKKVNPNEIGNADLGQIDTNSFLKLQYLISQFVDVISTNSTVSLVLWLDDLQWADEASLTILYGMLRQKLRRKFFFIGCCRDDEVRNNHAFWKMMGNDGADLGVHVTPVKLNCMAKNTLNGVISDLLCLSPRLVQSLSDIVYSRTKGNILFFLQLMMLLYRDNLLYIDLDRKRWTWNEDQIVRIKLPENIAICLTDTICKLPIEVQKALNTLSMLGASAKLSYLKIFESHLRLNILEPLKEAAAEGLVTASDGSFRFCHDRIQEASLYLIGEGGKRRHHLVYGKCLVERAAETNDDEMLFTAVDQINLAGPAAITYHRDYLEMAHHNLVAGKRAMSMADFASALSFFSNGVIFLRDGHWQDQYAISLEIHELACKSAFAARKISDLNVLSDKVLKNARSFEDTLEIQLIYIDTLGFSKPAKALELGLSIISKIEEDIPTTTKEALGLQQVQDMVKDMPEEFFLNLEVMKDMNKLIVMKFLSRIQLIAFTVKPKLNPSVTLKMLQLTISHGE